MLGVSISDDDIILLFEVRTDIRGSGCGDVIFCSGDSWTLGLDRDDIVVQTYDSDFVETAYFDPIVTKLVVMFLCFLVVVAVMVICLNLKVVATH
jgi:hypothetical protein